MRLEAVAVDGRGVSHPVLHFVGVHRAAVGASAGAEAKYIDASGMYAFDQAAVTVPAAGPVSFEVKAVGYQPQTAARRDDSGGLPPHRHVKPARRTTHAAPLDVRFRPAGLAN